MEESTPLTKFITIAAAFGLGVLAMKYFGSASGSVEEDKKDDNKKEKKVSFPESVEKEQEMKEIIKLAIKETLNNLETKEKKRKPGPTMNKEQSRQDRRRMSESEEPIYKI